MDKFYVIKLFNSRSGSRGYLAETPKGIVISDVLYTNTKQFVSEKEARQYIKENKLERQGVSAHVRSNEDLIADGHIGTPLDKNKELWTAMDLSGAYVFFDAGKTEYYFERRDVGYCIWYDEKSVNEFIEKMQFPYEVLAKKVSK